MHAIVDNISLLTRMRMSTVIMVDIFSVMFVFQVGKT